MQVDTDMAKQFQSHLKKLEKILDQKIWLSWSDLKQHQIIVYKDKTLETEPSQELVAQTLEHALVVWNTMRLHEGKILLKALQQHIETASHYVQQIKEITKNLSQLYLKKLEKNLKMLLSGEHSVNIDNKLLAQEIALFAEKKDISEELERLDAHFQHFDTLFHLSESGKQAGFLTQECLREINTVSSKIPSVDVAKLVIAVKSELEKIREQLNNIE